MNRCLSVFLAIVAMSPAACLAEAPVPTGHSTVHVVFIAPQSQQSRTQPMIAGMVGAQKPMARVGNLFLPADEIRPIRITIDGDFVGHAMVGPQDITPVFVLPKGLHKFTFVIEGSDPAPAEITVLGTGSKQYLIAKLPSGKTLPKDSGTSVDATAVQPSGN